MLGMHGGTVMVTKDEDGSFWIGELGVMRGDSYTAANGDYVLTTDAEGMRFAAYQTAMGTITVGETGLVLTAMSEP